MLSNEYKERASKTYLEYVKACSTLLSMIETEIYLAEAVGRDSSIEVLNDRKERYSQEVRRADNLISNLDDTLAEVLRRQYIECQSQRRIADEIGYALRSVERFSHDGRAEFYELLPEEYR